MYALYDLLWHTQRRFVAFDAAHIAALLLFTLLAALLVWFGRSNAPSQLKTAIRVGLGICILVFETIYVLYPLPLGSFDIRYSLPFQVCDITAYASAIALISGWAIPREISCFLGLTTTLIACFAPDVAYTFPHIEFICFFISHALVVAATLYQIVGLREWPAPGAARRVFFFINGYGAWMCLVNLYLGSNYVFLCSTPRSATPMNWLGPWPWYIAVMDALFIGMLALLHTALRSARRRAPA